MTSAAEVETVRVLSMPADPDEFVEANLEVFGTLRK
jgi:hypothetical protein